MLTPVVDYEVVVVVDVVDVVVVGVGVVVPEGSARGTAVVLSEVEGSGAIVSTEPISSLLKVD